MEKEILAGVFGLLVGDALGLPAEFVSRKNLKASPIETMVGGDFPPGTWSDDSSMALVLVDKLGAGFSYQEIMEGFLAWYERGAYTPLGFSFGVGRTTSEALERFRAGTPPLQCGGKGEKDNGNGSLMRILPLVFYLRSVYGRDFSTSKEAMDLVHGISSLTHAHTRAQLACGIYLSLASSLMDSRELELGVTRGLERALDYYQAREEFSVELEHFSRIFDGGFKELGEEEISSGGYVVDSLEASLWSLLTSKDFKGCLLRAVNLGGDSDTTGAIAGGLAGLYYGYRAIPKEWIEALLRRDYVETLCGKFLERL